MIRGTPTVNMNSMMSTKIQNSTDVFCCHLIRFKRLREPRYTFPAPGLLP